MKNFTFSKTINYLTIRTAIGIILITGGCYYIQKVIQPETADPHTPFNVKVSLITDNSYEPADFTPSFGYIGILLPEGWKVKDSVYYSKSSSDGSNQNGLFKRNPNVEVFLKNKKGLPPVGYYWWGACSTYLIDLKYNESGTVNLTITPNEKVGLYKIKYFFGDDNDWNKQYLTDLFGIVTESDYIPIQVKSLHSGTNRSFEELKVFPNPATNQVTFSWNSNPEILNLKIYNPNGTCITEKEISSNETVDVSGFPKGIYLYRLSNKNEVLKSGKLVVE